MWIKSNNSQVYLEYEETKYNLKNYLNKSQYKLATFRKGMP